MHIVDDTADCFIWKHFPDSSPLPLFPSPWLIFCYVCLWTLALSPLVCHGNTQLAWKYRHYVYIRGGFFIYWLTTLTNVNQNYLLMQAGAGMAHTYLSDPALKRVRQCCVKHLLSVYAAASTVTCTDGNELWIIFFLFLALGKSFLCQGSSSFPPQDDGRQDQGSLPLQFGTGRFWVSWLTRQCLTLGWSSSLELWRNRSS